MTGIGPVAVRCPRVRDRVGEGSERIRFSSAILPPYARRSKSLGLVRRDDPATMLVAKAIMEAAKQGERDPLRLQDLAVEKLTSKAHYSQPSSPNSLLPVAAAPGVAEETQVAVELEPSQKR
jgi:hypothetical protein